MPRVTLRLAEKVVDFAEERTTPVAGGARELQPFILAGAWESRARMACEAESKPADAGWRQRLASAADACRCGPIAGCHVSGGVQMSAGSAGVGGEAGRLAGRVWAGPCWIGPDSWAEPGLLRMAKMPFFVVF